VIIFGKFGDGQSDRNRAVLFFPGNPVRIVALVSPHRLLALTKDGTKEGSPSQMGEGISHSALATPSAMLTRTQLAVVLRGTRVAGHGPRTPISNRELGLLERALSHCKQRKATVSNRELSTNQCSCSLRVTALLRGPRIAGRGSRPLTTFLTGFASQTEFDVTPSEQTTGEFLTGARTAIDVPQFRAEFCTKFTPKQSAQHKKESGSRDASEQGKIASNIRKEKETL
jgi:hypothetical protein